MYKYNLLSQTGRHPKTDKNLKVNVLTAIMHLAPADSSGYEVCPMRSAGCTASCLNYAGFQYAKKQAARIARTKFFFEDRATFMERLCREIRALERRAKKLSMRAGIRLNGTSDITWESVGCFYDNGFANTHRNVMSAFPNVCFYDYTKRVNRKNLPSNYRLTFSRSEENDSVVRAALDNGMNVAMVFRGPDLPAAWYPGGFLAGQDALRVIDGDEHDFRYDDPAGVVVGLRAKGVKARKDTSGFVIDWPAKVAA